MNWNNPEVIDEKTVIDTDAAIEETASVNYEPETDAYMKQQAKERRQQLKLSCLENAIRVSQKFNQAGNLEFMKDTEIIATAKAFYAFVRT